LKPAASRRSTATALSLVLVAAGMGGLAYASVPLYQLFCQVTGYGGTTQTAAAAPAEIGERVIKVRFNADTGRDMPWRFHPAQREIAVRVGEPALAYYEASNPSALEVTGSATFNVTPQKAGVYFTKVACFCFEEQVLAPGESAELPVSFYIDPEIVEDRNLDDVGTITLSYTFFKRAERPVEASVRVSAAPPVDTN
jgi:cytochrome c oxidase assembly protein subunit 11